MNYYELFGHVASLLTVGAYLFRDILWLRLLAILSCFAGMAYHYYVPPTPMWSVIIWNVVFVAINAVQIVIIIKERSGVHFSEEEKELHETLFKQFAPFEFMKLMRIGKWLHAKPGEILAVEQKPLDNVMLIYNGRAGVENHGVQVAQLKDGNFIGEVSFIGGGMATATVRTIEPTRYIAWPKTDLAELLKRNPTMKSGLQAMLSTDLSKKLSHRAPSFQGKIQLPLP